MYPGITEGDARGRIDRKHERPARPGRARRRKLIHRGLRYLEQGELHLVREALR
jgi:hypothetical protein